MTDHVPENETEVTIYPAYMYALGLVDEPPPRVGETLSPEARVEADLFEQTSDAMDALTENLNPVPPRNQ